MTPESPIRFRSGNLELSGLVAVPEGATRACVVCHPHPLYGGDMHNNVVTGITQALLAAGVATLRFDFRGVGESAGSHDGGRGEVEDAIAAATELAARARIERVALAGYSFGAVVALRAALSSKGTATAAIAPPLAMFDATFAAGIDAPLLLIAGDRDTYCPSPQFRALTERLAGRASTLVLEKADHFLAGRESEIGAAVAGWLERV